jgi:hypothetical protein
MAPTYRFASANLSSEPYSAALLVRFSPVHERLYTLESVKRTNRQGAMRVSEHYELGRSQATLDFVDVDIVTDTPSVYHSRTVGACRRVRYALCALRSMPQAGGGASSMTMLANDH